MGFALAWARVWPASLAALAAGLVWTADAMHDPEGERLRAFLARTLPLCDDRQASAGSAASARAPARLVGWLRRTGG
jgi:hypothetical protein